VSVLPVLIALLLNLLLPISRAGIGLVSAADGSLNIVKTADDDEIVAGDEASFDIVIWNRGEGDALDAEFFDQLPPGVWSFELVNEDDDDACGMASGVEIGGEPTQTVSCDFGTLEPSEMPTAPFTAESPGKVIRVFRDTDGADCGLLHNEAWADASNDDRVFADDSILVECLSLVIDKVADAEVIVISGPNDELVATPSAVTWTLTYTLTDGPVTNAVITDEVPVGFEFLDASNGGQLIDGVVTWTFPTLTESGSVTFRTTVDPEAISRVAPTLNVAVIDSDQTGPDDGQDSVTVSVEPPPLGGNPTPGASMPDTATITGSNGEPITVPVELLATFFTGSLGALALAHARSGSRRR
jgi:uncharacterized repeat protein (TIGR01451 family)